MSFPWGLVLDRCTVRVGRGGVRKNKPRFVVMSDCSLTLELKWLYFLSSYIDFTVDSPLGMTDDEILRAEMVAQLCMNDRTHSSLLDLISFESLVYKRYIDIVD